METRDRIIEEANRQFLKYGIRQVRMDDIANELGISKRTVYEVFKDKNELVRECLLVLQQRKEEMHRNIEQRSTNVLEKMIFSMQEGMKILTTVNPVFFSDLKKYYPAIANQIHESDRMKDLSMLHTKLRKGINEGLFRKEINVELVSILFHEQLNMIGNDDAFPRDKFSYADIFKELMFSFMRGISTTKGVEMIDKMLD